MCLHALIFGPMRPHTYHSGHLRCLCPQAPSPTVAGGMLTYSADAGTSEPEAPTPASPGATAVHEAAPQPQGTSEQGLGELSKPRPSPEPSPPRPGQVPGREGGRVAAPPSKRLLRRKSSSQPSPAVVRGRRSRQERWVPHNSPTAYPALQMVTKICNWPENLVLTTPMQPYTLHLYSNVCVVRALKCHAGCCCTCGTLAQIQRHPATMAGLRVS